MQEIPHQAQKDKFTFKINSELCTMPQSAYGLSYTQFQAEHFAQISYPRGYILSRYCEDAYSTIPLSLFTEDVISELE